MNTLIQLFKEILILTFGLFAISLVLKLFLKHTLIGKVITIILKDIYLFVRLWFRVMKKSSRLTYKLCKKIYTVLNKEYKKHGKKKKNDKVDKKVVNGEFDNVIDLQKFMAQKQQNKSK